MKHFFLILLTLLLLIGAKGSHAQWEKTTLSQAQVYSFAMSGDTILAGTENGIFQSTNEGNSWTNIFPYDVIPSILFNGGTIMAISAGGEGLYLSHDDGGNWLQADSGLSAFFGTALLADSSAIFAAMSNHGVFKSTDNGNYWFQADNGITDLYAQCFGAVDSDIFVGTNDIPNGKGKIFRSTDNGASWREADSGMLGSGILTLVEYRGYLFAGTVSGGVYYTTDDGASWQSAIGNLSGEGQANVLLEAGDDLLVGTTDVGIYRTINFGAVWGPLNTIESGGSLGGIPILTLALDAEYVFAGTEGEGLLRFPISKLGVSSSKSLTTISLEPNFPNPFSASTTIRFSTPSAAIATLTITDEIGRVVAIWNYRELEEGCHSVEWDASTLHSGVYFCSLQCGGKGISEPLTVIR